MDVGQSNWVVEPKNWKRSTPFPATSRWPRKKFHSMHSSALQIFYPSGTLINTGHTRAFRAVQQVCCFHCAPKPGLLFQPTGQCVNSYEWYQAALCHGLSSSSLFSTLAGSSSPDCHKIRRALLDHTGDPPSPVLSFTQESIRRSQELTEAWHEGTSPTPKSMFPALLWDILPLYMEVPFLIRTNKNWQSWFTEVPNQMFPGSHTSRKRRW